MKTYLVGGAVRDELLGRPVHERDWVVTGATTEEMLALGYQQVGRDFPVFIHPKSKEEYALARQERINSAINSKNVTLEEDLSRRDLTINAIAKDTEGKLIAPHGGLHDLELLLLRHVDSTSFKEDPIRLLRVARFAARYHHLGFSIATETLELMQSMVNNGEIHTLQAERVWKETSRALDEETPSIFIRVLKQCGALKVIFPEIDALYGVPQKATFHPEIDTGKHLELALDRGHDLGASNACMYAILLHDLGKGVTPKEMLPSHRGHEETGIPYVREVNKRLKVPTKHAQLAELVCRWHFHCHRALELRHKTIIKLFDALDIWRQPDRLENFLTACQADSQGRAGMRDIAYPQVDYLRRCAERAKNIDIKALMAEGYEGAVLGEAIRRARIAQLASL